MFNQAVKDLTKAIKFFTRNDMFKVSDTTTNSFEEFVKETDRDGCITVSLQGNENTIYGDKVVNILSRVWHDKIHLEFNLNFSLKQEMSVAEVQRDRATSYLTPLVGIDRAKNAGRLIYLDIVEQGKYYEKYKVFLVHQKSFIENRWYNYKG